MWRWIFKAPLGLSLPSAFQNEVPSRVASAAATHRAGPLSSCPKTVYGSRSGPARPEGYFETCSKGLLRLKSALSLSAALLFSPVALGDLCGGRVRELRPPVLLPIEGPQGVAMDTS